MHVAFDSTVIVWWCTGLHCANLIMSLAVDVLGYYCALLSSRGFILDYTCELLTIALAVHFIFDQVHHIPFVAAV